MYTAQISAMVHCYLPDVTVLRPDYPGIDDKYYLCDTGIRYAVLGHRNLDYGRLYETSNCAAAATACMSASRTRKRWTLLRYRAAKSFACGSAMIFPIARHSSVRSRRCWPSRTPIPRWSLAHSPPSRIDRLLLHRGGPGPAVRCLRRGRFSNRVPPYAKSGPQRKLFWLPLRTASLYGLLPMLACPAFCFIMVLRIKIHSAGQTPVHGTGGVSPSPAKAMVMFASVPGTRTRPGNSLPCAPSV